MVIKVFQLKPPFQLKMRFFYILSLLFLMIPCSSFSIRINEIMADPEADESLNEWIEIYNNDSQSINVSRWAIGDDSDRDIIEGGLYGKEGTIIPPFGFAIVTDEATRVYNNFNVSDDAIRLYVDDGSIGNSLSNEGERIYLYDSSDLLIDSIIYNSTTEGLSWAFLNESLKISDPSPGFSNDESIIEYSSCDYSVSFLLKKTIFDNSSEFDFKIRISKVSGHPTNFTMNARIEDLNGKLIKEYHPFTNQSISSHRTSSTYTPNLDDGKSYILSTNITTDCNDTSNQNNFESVIVTIKGKPLSETSSLNIENIYDLGSDNEAKFGQTIRVKLNVYKGNTNKESIALWVQKGSNRLSKQSKVNIEEKYSNHSFTLPIQLDPNCDKEFDDDSYDIVAEGLDETTEKEVDIAGLTDSLCETILEENKKRSTGDFSYDLLEYNELVSTKKEVTSRLVLDNPEDKPIDVKAWSYVYRGSKCYSGEREDNIQSFTLPANSLRVIELKNELYEAEPGEYKLKVKINKDNQKTDAEITKDITLNFGEEREITEEESVQSSEEKENQLLEYGVIYESTTEKAKSLVPLFFIFTLSLLCIIMILRK